MASRTHSVADPHPLDWQDPATINRVKQALTVRRVHKDGPGTIELVQTHISSVFLTQEHVFKFKRPVDAGFVNYASLRARLHFCNEELRLNRRLAPDVYIGLVALRAVGNRFSFGRQGQVVDYAVVMKRLPSNRMLDARLRAGDVRAEEIDAVAERIARFHRLLHPSIRGAHFGSLDTWKQNWQENFDQTLPELDATIPAAEYHSLKERIFTFLDQYCALFQARMDGGFVRNGHGDLRCEHICVADPIRIIDCVEFSERFRIGDTANDLAFLLMDLCALGSPHWAARLLERYNAVTKDKGAIGLVAFYCCYRAYVRGKVLGMRLRDRNLPSKARAEVEKRARAFFDLAKIFARQMGPPVLLLVSGLMGSGKSTLAEGIGARTGMMVLSSDRIRKEIAGGKDMAIRDMSAFEKGIYSPAWTERTYTAMLVRSRDLLTAGTSVILDATFNRRDHRHRAFSLARELGAQVMLVECVASDEVTLTRLKTRESLGRSISDGRAELYPQQRAQFQKIDEIPKEQHLVVRTEGSLEAGVAQVLRHKGLHIPEPLFSPLSIHSSAQPVNRT